MDGVVGHGSPLAPGLGCRGGPPDASLTGAPRTMGHRVLSPPPAGRNPVRAGMQSLYLTPSPMPTGIPGASELDPRSPVRHASFGKILGPGADA